jgi:hypothetical protein
VDQNIKNLKRVIDGNDYANAILNFVEKSHGQFTRTQVRKLFDKANTWLYRNNRELLAKVLPEPIKVRQVKKHGWIGI